MASRKASSASSPRSNADERDWGTTELARRFTVVPRLSGAYSFHGKVIDDSEMDRLLAKDAITPMEYSLLEALLKKLHKATFVGLKSPDFNGVATSDPSHMSDRKACAVMSICHIVRVMDKLMGKANRAALINLVLLDQPWPNGLPLLHR